MTATLKYYVRKGLGLIWRLALYFVVLFGAFWLLSKGYSWATHALGVQFVRTPTVRPAEAVFFGQARLLIAAILAWVVTARLGRDQTEPVLPFQKGAISHLQGSLWGFAAIGVTIGLITMFGGYRIDGIALRGWDLAYYVPLWLAIALVNGLAENLAIMGYPLFRTARVAGWVPATILVSLLFAAAHLGNPGEDVVGIVSIFVMSFVMAAAIWLTGNLWLSVGLHAGVIIGEDLVFSVPDSGATYTGHLLESTLMGPQWLSGGDGGPEAAIFALPVFIILLGALSYVYRRRAYDAETVSLHRS